MGFYTVDVNQWCVTRLSQPILTGENDRNLLQWKEFNQGKSLVVFPGGIIDCGEAWAVSFGWNDCRCCVQLYEKKIVLASLINIA